MIYGDYGDGAVFDHLYGKRFQFQPKQSTGNAQYMQTNPTNIFGSTLPPRFDVSNPGQTSNTTVNPLTTNTTVNPIATNTTVNPVTAKTTNSSFGTPTTNTTGNTTNNQTANFGNPAKQTTGNKTSSTTNNTMSFFGNSGNSANTGIFGSSGNNSANTGNRGNASNAYLRLEKMADPNSQGTARITGLRRVVQLPQSMTIGADPQYI
jgi:hypothetical protein